MCVLFIPSPLRQQNRSPSKVIVRAKRVKLLSGTEQFLSLQIHKHQFVQSQTTYHKNNEPLHMRSLCSEEKIHDGGSMAAVNIGFQFTS
jgi:hypothetical protein